jgi:hypothetical protein
MVFVDSRLTVYSKEDNHFYTEYSLSIVENPVVFIWTERGGEGGGK